ncbi:hypothetical protein K458DRAFT_420434 [Lentithecium fluviatile CBS 122367]|uniref:Uncharacterized protein n=1 Tax=Lentithecium fluviatile CBS 122367 TaxID=1168545 RepID=A0A6G1IU86_9PLEO|nr:hypothetical protein K458DRAFT_420434 [Lentithecium fluviatile CBS 122367]
MSQRQTTEPIDDTKGSVLVLIFLLVHGAHGAILPRISHAVCPIRKSTASTALPTDHLAP